MVVMVEEEMSACMKWNLNRLDLSPLSPMLSTNYHPEFPCSHILDLFVCHVYILFIAVFPFFARPKHPLHFWRQVSEIPISLLCLFALECFGQIFFRRKRHGKCNRVKDVSNRREGHRQWSRWAGFG